jgi:hypothetical protein
MKTLKLYNILYNSQWLYIYSTLVQFTMCLSLRDILCSGGLHRTEPRAQAGLNQAFSFHPAAVAAATPRQRRLAWPWPWKPL